MPASKRIRYEVLRRDNHKCRYCGASAPDVKLAVDHVLPVALGGSDDPSNLVAACVDCNAGKSSTSPDGPLVAQVQEDSIRWAAAMEHAAQQAVQDRKKFLQQRADFAAKWNSWTINGTPVDLPGDWHLSVDRWLSLGLPLPLLLDAVDIAMGNRKIAHTSTWSYMAGLAWTKIRAIQDAAYAGYSAKKTAELHGDGDDEHGHEPDSQGVTWCSRCWGDGFDAGVADQQWRAASSGDTAETAYQRGYEDGSSTARAAMEAAMRPSTREPQLPGAGFEDLITELLNTPTKEA